MTKFNKKGNRIKIKFNNPIQLLDNFADCYDMFEDWPEYQSKCKVKTVARDSQQVWIIIKLSCQGVPGQLQVADTITFKRNVFLSLHKYEDGVANWQEVPMIIEAPNKAKKVKIQWSSKPQKVSSCAD